MDIAFLARRQPESAMGVLPTIAAWSAPHWLSVQGSAPMGLVYSRVSVLRGGPERSFVLADHYSVIYPERTDAGLDQYRITFRPTESPRFQPAEQLPAAMGPDGALHALVVVNGQILHDRWDGNRSQISVVTTPVTPLCQGSANWECWYQLWVDGAGVPHVLFREGTATHGTHAVPADGGWAYDPLPSHVKGGLLALSPSGEPTICFAEDGALLGSSTARCVRRRSGLWQGVDLVVNARDVHTRIYGVEELGNGELGVLYAHTWHSASPTRHSLTWSRWNGTAWTHLPVFGEATQALGGATVAVDHAGRPHLAVALGDRVLYLRPKP